MWYAIYRTADGTLVSVGSVLPNVADVDADLAARRLAKKSYVQRPDQRSGWLWNQTLLDFEDRTADLPAMLAWRDFTARFTTVEREALFAAQRDANLTRRNKIGAFFDYVQSDPNVNLRDPYVQRSVNAMETAGLIGAGRAAVILDETGLVP